LEIEAKMRKLKAKMDKDVKDRKNADSRIKQLADENRKYEEKKAVEDRAKAARDEGEWQDKYKKSKEDEAKFKADFESAKTAMTNLDTQIAGASGANKTTLQAQKAAKKKQMQDFQVKAARFKKANDQFNV